MKAIATIAADLKTAPLGTRSRLAADLLGEPVLRRTVRRVLACRRLAAVHVLSPVEQGPQIARLLSGLPIELETHHPLVEPYCTLVRAGRWWGLDGWRGGVGGLCVFDEDVHVGLLAALVQRVGADAVVSIPAAAAVIQPELIDAMVGHYDGFGGSVRMVIVQTPPGMGAIVLGRSLLEELAPTGQPPGVLLKYHPDNPSPDLTGRDACYRPPAEVIEARGRLLCDTRRGFDRVHDLLAAGGETWTPAQIGAWLSRRTRQHVDAVPEEIEIELTTDDALGAGSILRPRGRSLISRPRRSCDTGVPPVVDNQDDNAADVSGCSSGWRGPIDVDVIQSVIEAIRDYDDVRVVLGGFGEPCRHPRFPEICKMLRDSTAAAVAVRTSAAIDNLEAGGSGRQAARLAGLAASDTQYGPAPTTSDRAIESIENALFDTPVDVVEVTLDAASPDTYRRVHGVDLFEAVTSRLERWLARRSERQQVLPLIVPSFVKAAENIDDMETFFDAWQRRLGSVVINGYSNCAGQLPSREVTRMAPPERDPCRRVLTRALILADGRMTTCDQDFGGRQTVGIVGQTPLAELWQGDRLAAVRSNQIGDLPLCPNCQEWHRP